MAVLDERWFRRRFLILLALRWLPTGFLIPVLVLLAQSRGLSLTEIGLSFSIQGFVVLALELPTGGLADSIGRRPILVAARVVSILSLALLAVADTVASFAAAMALQGIYRALDSGPLEAWYVDAALAADPAARIDRGLSHGTALLSLSIGVGALASGALVQAAPIGAAEALAVPVLVAIALALVDLVALLGLMVEPPAARIRRTVRGSFRAVPSVIREGLGLLGRSRVLLGLVAVEASWGFAMVTFETLFPVRLSEVVGDPIAAAALMGPVVSAAWFVSAGGAAVVGLVAARVGVARAASGLRVIQGVAIVAMGVLVGPAGVVAAYLGCYLANGASSPMHLTLLHREVEGPNRTTVLSINSMVGQPAGAVGALVLGVLADGTSVTTAMILGGIVCLAAAPFYLPARWAERRRARLASPPTPA